MVITCWSFFGIVGHLLFGNHRKSAIPKFCKFICCQVKVSDHLVIMSTCHRHSSMPGWRSSTPACTRTSASLSPVGSSCLLGERGLRWWVDWVVLLDLLLTFCLHMHLGISRIEWVSKLVFYTQSSGIVISRRSRIETRCYYCFGVEYQFITDTGICHLCSALISIHKLKWNTHTVESLYFPEAHRTIRVIFFLNNYESVWSRRGKSMEQILKSLWKALYHLRISLQ